MQANSDDFVRTPYHRTHMATWQNHRKNFHSLANTYVATNNAPVFQVVNNGALGSAELFCRDRVLDHGAGLVITLCIFRP